MKWSINPTLSDLEKRDLESLLIDALSAPEYCERGATNTAYTALGKLGLYRDDKLYTIRSYDYWTISTQICIGQYGVADGYASEVSMKDRLMILIALSGYLGERSTAMEAAIKQAVLKHLYREYKEINSQTLIEAAQGVQQDGIALNEKDGQVAFLLADTWMLPSGETVDVEKPGWEVYANKFPVVETVVAEAMPVAPAAPTADGVQF